MLDGESMSLPYRDNPGGPLGALRSVHAERSGCLLRVIVGVTTLPIVAVAYFQGVPVITVIEMAIVILLGVGALWWIGKRNPPGRIELHESGLSSHARNQVQRIRFDDVRSITSSKQRRGTAGVEIQHHIVEAKDGTRIAFNLIYDRALDLLAAIEAATQPRLSSEARERYDAGEVLRFGPIALSEDGFFDGDRAVVPWSDIERAGIEMPTIAPGLVCSELKVWKTGEKDPIAAYATERIPNANVMLDVLSLAVEVADEEAS